jgi:hypothetical protein
VVTSRVKDCESALQKLRRFQEGATFDNDQSEKYTLTTLKDLAGVRVLVFPRRRIHGIDVALRNVFPWDADPTQEDGEVLAIKYRGTAQPALGLGVNTRSCLFWQAFEEQFEALLPEHRDS